MVRFVQYNLPLGLTIATSFLANDAHAFSTNNVRHAPTAARTALHAFAERKYDEEKAVWLMDKARECAYSDTCSLDDATYYLNEVVHVQGSCTAGTLSGNELCDDVTAATEIVAGLRRRISEASERNSNMARASSEAGKFPLTPVYVGLAALCFLVTTNDAATTTATPFTAQEWFWAARDGYLPNMVSAFVRDGGFVVDPDATSTVSSVMPFTGQEWWWSARDGYLGDVVSVAMREGGLPSDGQADVSPFEAKEWWWSVRDGYLGNMVSQSFKNGGL